MRVLQGEKCFRSLPERLPRPDEAEYIEDLRCLAAPIRDSQGEIVASVGISSPVTRLHTKRIPQAAAEVVATAQLISKSLAA